MITGSYTESHTGSGYLDDLTAWMSYPFGDKVTYSTNTLESAVSVS